MNTTIKITTLLLGVALVFAACKDDKQARLVKLKKTQQEINAQIMQLETEIANDTSILKTVDRGVTVAVAEVQAKPFAHYIEAQGKLDGEDNVMLFPKGQGVVLKVYAKVGDKVSKGQLIAQLDDAAYQKNLAQMRSQYDLAKEMFDRQSRLWDQKIGSEVQYLQAKAQKESLESAIAGLEEQIDYMKIKSPINGSVEDLPLKVGQAVSPAMPVATIINFSALKVVADVAEAYGSSIATGDSVSLYFPDLKKEVPSTIASASKFINPVNRSFKVEVRLNSDNQNLKANMIVVMKIADYKKDKAIVVPVNLIQTDATGNYVYTAKVEDGNKTARKKYIEQGISYNGVVEVTTGLSAGDIIITNGHLGLIDGAKINF
jgi:membrane fusion protein, multidrug efflux system